MRVALQRFASPPTQTSSWLQELLPSTPLVRALPPHVCCTAHPHPHAPAVALHDVKKLYNAARAKLGELKSKIASQAAAAAPPPLPPPPLLLVAAKSFAASRSLPTLQPEDPASFFASIESLICVLERSLAHAQSQAVAAQSALKTPPASPASLPLDSSGRCVINP